MEKSVRCLVMSERPVLVANVESNLNRIITQTRNPFAEFERCDILFARPGGATEESGPALSP
jgi:hypothetical protein